MFVEYRGCNYKDTKMQENQEQEFILGEHLRNVWHSSYLRAQRWRENTAREREAVSVKYRWYKRKDIVEGISEEDRKKILCLECGTRRKQPWWNWKAAVYPIQGEVQQDGIQTGALKGTIREGGTRRDMRRTFKMLREVWLNIGVEKIDTHEGVTVKALLDSSVTEMFMDRKIAAKHGFKLQKLKRPVTVRNVDRTNNSAKAITYQVEVNIYYKNHIKRMRIDVCNLGKIDIILGMLQLQAHNLEINWETEEVKITRYLPLCGRNIKLKKEKRMMTLEKEKIVKQVVNNKEDWKREKEVKADYRKIEEIVLQKFLKWKKYLGR